jgi:hypothetical protein
MSRTSVKAEMKFIDVTALGDSTFTSDTIQAFSNLGLLSEDNETESNNYADLGINQMILDGSKAVLDGSEQDIGYWSSVRSNDNCLFDDNPVLAIDFTEAHSSSGLTLYFAEDYPTQIRITWYDLEGNKIIGATFNPDSLIYVCKKQVTNYGKIEIEFMETSFPEQYIHLQYVLFGQYLQWSDTEIKTAKVVEEVDVTSNQLSINTAEVELIDEVDDFDISNSNGAWKSVQKNQIVTFTESVDDSVIPIGAFYIDKFSFKNNVVKFDLIDAVGLLDKTTFDAGTIYLDETVGNIVDAIMRGTGIEYELDPELSDITLSGYLAIQSSRAALQQVAFVIGAVVDDSRSDKVRIYKPNRLIQHVVGIERKFNGTSDVTQDEYVSGVAVEFSKYTLANESNQIYDDVLSNGDNRIEFSGPYKADSVTVSAGIIKDVTTNYIIVEMPTSGKCTIEGTPYEENKFTVSKMVDIVDAGEAPNIKKYEGITLFNPEMAESKLQSLLSYHSLRKVLSMKYLLDTEKSGEWANVQNIKHQGNATLIEKQTIDLTGGFTASATSRGYTLIIDSEYYTGSELYTGEEVGVI